MQWNLSTHIHKLLTLLCLVFFTKVTISLPHYAPIDSSMLLTVKINCTQSKLVLDSLYVSLIDSLGNLLETKKASISIPADFEVKTDKYYKVRVRDSFIVKDKCSIFLETNISTYNKIAPFTIVVNAEVWRPTICCNYTLENIVFKKNNATLNSSAKEILDKLVRTLKNNPTLEISISSTVSKDERISRSYLIHKRNQNVLHYITEQYIDTNRIQVEYYENKVLSSGKKLGETYFRIAKLK